MRCLTAQEKSGILRSSSINLLQSNSLSLRMTNAIDNLCKGGYAEFISASLACAFGQRFRNKFGMTINHNKSCHPERSEGSLTNCVGINPSPQSSPLGEEEIGGFSHSELTRKLSEKKSMRNFLFLLGVSESSSERLGAFPSPREEGVGERVQLIEKINSSFKKCAFTLAEVLITLGIIGVVAAMTIPGLITKYHKHVIETKLQRFDSIMNQAVRMAIAENGEIIYEPPANEATNAEYLKEWFNDNLMKYLKANYEGEVIAKKYYKVSFLDGTGFVSYIPNDGGTIYFFFCSDVRDKSCHVESFDGQHTFLFDYAKDKEAVLPHGYTINDVEKLKYLDNGTTGCYVKTNPNRHLCTQLIKLNGWKIPSDYPWIK